MIYGYDSKIQSNGIQQIIDYKRDFLAQLKEARKTEDVITNSLRLNECNAHSGSLGKDETNYIHWP